MTYADARKVLFIASGSSFYGANRSLFFLVKDLKARYNIFPIVITNEKGIFVDKMRNSGIRVIVIPYPNRVVNSQRKSWFIRKWIKKLLRVLSFPVCYYFIRPQIQGVQIVHSNSGTVDFGCYLSQKLGVDHVWHIREFGYLDYKLISIDDKNSIIEKYNKERVKCQAFRPKNRRIRSHRRKPSGAPGRRRQRRHRRRAAARGGNG